MKKQTFYDKLLLSLGAVILATGCVGLSFFPSERYSPKENRYLAPFPAVALADILSGRTTAGLENYATERFFLRTPCRSLWSGAQLALGQREAHGVILCRDGSLSRRLSTDATVYRKNVAALQRLQKLCALPLTLAVAPRRLEARSEVLPLGYDTASEHSDWQSLPWAVSFCDCTADTCWFRTDHHWTQEGAYFAYARLGEQLGYTPYAPQDFWQECVSSSFLGSSDAAAGLPFVSPDSLTLWHFAHEERLTLTRDGVAAEFAGIYDLQKLKERDQYAVFLGGNCGVTEISQGAQDTRPLLVVIKDSFGNPLLPFLSRHFRIRALDPRYAPLSLAELSCEAQGVLVLCGIQTLTQTPFSSLIT